MESSGAVEVIRTLTPKQLEVLENLLQRGDESGYGETIMLVILILGIAVYIIEKLVLPFIRKNDKTNCPCDSIKEITTTLRNAAPSLDLLDKSGDMIVKKIDDLHSWHNVSDDDGTKVWYSTGTMKKQIENTNTLMQRLEITNQELQKTINKNSEVIEKTLTVLDKILSKE